MCFGLYKSQAQITLKSNLIPPQGTDFYEVEDTMLTNLNVFGSGPNQFWDYSGSFIPADTSYTNIISAKLTPYTDSFPTSNLSIHFEKDSMWAYYKSDSTGIYFMGVYFEKPGYIRATRNDPPDLFFPYNFTYNDFKNNNSILHLYAGNMYQKSYSMKKITADAYGTVKTPVGTFSNVLRLRSEKIQYDSLFMWNDTLLSYQYIQDTTFSEYEFHWIQNHSLYGDFVVMQIKTDSTLTDFKEAKFTLPTRCPLGAFLASDTLICAGKKVYFRRINNFLNATINWSLLGIPIDTAEFFGREFNVPGVYPMELVASNDICTDTVKRLLYVRPAPAASAGDDTTINAGQSVTLTASGGDKFYWNTGDSSKSITVNPPISTTYSVLVAANGCGNMAHVAVKVINSLLPSLSFRQTLYGVDPLKKPDQQLCEDTIFKRLIFKRPVDSVEAMGACFDQHTSLFDSIPPDRFRLKLSPVTLGFLDFSTPPGHRRIYTGGSGVIERRLINDTYIPVLSLTDISIVGNFTCGEAHAGRMVGRFKKLPGDLSDEFSALGNDFFIGIFSNFDTLQRGGYHEYATDMEIVPIKRPFVAQGKPITGLNTPIRFDSTGVTLNFSSFISQTSPDSTNATVVQYFENISDIVNDDSVATIFNNEFWELGSTLDSLSAEVCFTFDSTKFNTRRIEKLSLVFQKHSGAGWDLIGEKPSINGNQICFRTDHFSNWALAITKPDAKVAIDTVLGNMTGGIDTVYQEYKESGINVFSLLDAGKTDTIQSIRYDMNPGGDMPQSVTEILEVFWEFYGENRNDIILDFDDSTAVGFENYGYQRVLYRPNSAGDWGILPSTRVRRGMKEVLQVKIPASSSRQGQYSFGKTSEVQPYFEVTVTTDTACAGEGIQFYPVATGGTEPYTYEWTVDKGILLSTEPIYLFDTVGVYAYSVKATDGNGATTVYSDSLHIDCLVGMNENLSERSLMVYPNPVNGDLLRVFILNYENVKPHTLLMLDNTGRPVYRKALNSATYKRSIDVDIKNLSSGIYYLLVKGETGNYGKRVMKIGR